MSISDSSDRKKVNAFELINMFLGQQQGRMFDVKAKPQVYESTKKFHQKKFSFQNGFQDLNKSEPPHQVNGETSNTPS